MAKGRPLPYHSGSRSRRIGPDPPPGSKRRSDKFLTKEFNMKYPDSVSGRKGPYYRRQTGTTLPGERTQAELNGVNALRRRMGLDPLGGSKKRAAVSGIRNPVSARGMNPRPPKTLVHRALAARPPHEAHQMALRKAFSNATSRGAHGAAPLRSAVNSALTYHAAVPSTPKLRPANKPKPLVKPVNIQAKLRRLGY